MVKLEELEALDLLLWLQNGTIVADLRGTNQSTVSRRCQRVLRVFNARLQRRRSGWKLRSNLDSLLDLQRQLHQQYRFRCGLDLRLNVPWWSQSSLRPERLSGWLVNPTYGPILCDNPLELLRAHVIEACLITPTQAQAQNLDDLVLFDLYESRIDLYSLIPPAQRGILIPLRSRSEDLDLFAGSRLQLVSFLPGSCRLSSQQRYRDLRFRFGLPAEEPQEMEAPSVAFLTPLMARCLNAPRRMDVPLDWPYRESLAVLRSNAHEPAIQQLVEGLRASLSHALVRVGEVRLAS